MISSDNTSSSIKNSLTKVMDFVIKKRLIMMIIIVGAAIALALIQTRSFIDVPRNESRYIEESLTIKYKQINSDILEEFKSAVLDGDINVDSNFNPNRNNPFNE